MGQASVWTGIAGVAVTLAWLATGCAGLVMGTYVFFMFAIFPLGFALFALLVALVTVTIGSWQTRAIEDLPWRTWVATLLPFAAVAGWMLQEEIVPDGSQLGLVAVPVIVWLAMLLAMPLHVVRGGRRGGVALGIGVLGVVAVAVTWWRADPGETLQSAARGLSPVALRVLLADGRSPDLVDWCGTTPLMSACEAGRIDNVRVLLAHGADPGHVADCGSVLTSAKYHPEIVALLLEAGAPPDPRVVEWASRDGSSALVAMLREAGADFSEPSAFLSAVSAGRTSLVAEMLDAGSPVTGIQQAADAGDIEMVQLLLARGANPKDAYPAESSLLAAAGRSPPAVRLAMMEALGAAGVAADHEALEQAVMFKDEAAVRWLLENGAPPDPGLDAPGETPLAWAASWETNAGIVRLLLDGGADPIRAQVLPRSAQWADLELVRRLLDAGVPVDQPDRRGTPALWGAIYGGDVEVVRELLDRGADPSYTRASKTTIELAHELGNPEIVALLEAECR